MPELYDVGHRQALLVWADDPSAGLHADPRHPEFAAGVLAGLTQSLKSAPGAMKRVVRHAGAAAEDLNVDAFQGVVEVLQNADDLGATAVRFAVVDSAGKRRLLIVHDGAPVTYPHVLAMMLPYLTTKSGDAEQKGRFGIGLKTLKRISTRIGVHCAPYHFTADGLDLLVIPPAEAIDGFYNPACDTLFALDLVEEFSADELGTWFKNWSEDDLLFLRSVRAFSFFDLDEGVAQVRTIGPDEWRRLSEPTGDLPGLSVRQMEGSLGAWTVFKAEIPTPEHLGRSHKATGAMTVIQVALPKHDHPAGLFIGFRTRIPVSLPFSIDAQFDPSTTRESLIANPWNRWLIARCGDVVAAIGMAELEREPTGAWRTIPLEAEGVGLALENWPAPQFGAAFSEARRRLAEGGAVGLEGVSALLATLAYEDAGLTRVMDDDDLVRLASDHRPLPKTVRDDEGRWRAVLDGLGVSRVVTAHDLVRGFSDDLFRDRSTPWWVAVADVLIAELADGIFGVPAFLTEAGEPRAVLRRGETARRLVIGETLSAFAARWRLFERLHDAYREDDVGERVLAWLLRDAAVTTSVDVADELAAFAETFVDAPVYLDAGEVADLRDRFDQLTDVRAAPLGPLVGRAVLLDGFVFRSGKRSDLRVKPAQAYLSKTLDGEHPHWPVAAGTLPHIPWISAGYDIALKTGATRTTRKRADGTISRGPRKFLMLLGAACSPRVIRTNRKDWGRPARIAQLQALYAEFTPYDYISPDLDRVLNVMDKLTRKDRRLRSAALLKCLSRYWPTYAGTHSVPAHHMAIKHVYSKGEVPSEWFGRLCEVAWIAVGSGTLRVPGEAVVKTAQTQSVYSADDFISGIGPDDLRSSLATDLKIITDVRASDLVGLLEAARDAVDGVDPQRILSAYRSLAKLCPNPAGWNSRVGDLAIADLRRRFSTGAGLILAPGAWESAPSWRRPDQLFTGKDIFLDPSRFVPGGPSLTDLWLVLQVRRPSLDDCIGALKDLAQQTYGQPVEAALIEIYRYVEPLVAKAERRQRDRLRSLPVGALNVGWARVRPVYHVENRELRAQLATARPDLRFWAPPCDIHALPNVTAALGLTRCRPTITLTPAAAAVDLGEVTAPHFQRCVDHLSNELTRNDPVARDRLSVTWPELRACELYVHEAPFPVSVGIPEIPGERIQVTMRAVLEREPLRLHVEERALAQRENGGRAIASLFLGEAQRRIEAEWVASWHASIDQPVERMATASDEAHARAMAERAQASAAAIGAKIKVSKPASRATPALPPRRLKSAYGPVASVTVIPGRPPTPAPPTKPPALTPTAPAPSPPNQAPALGPTEYNNVDLEQQGWEILSTFLNASEDSEIVDFRKRHGVVADVVVAWKTFVELKATGRGPQSSVEMSATEFERSRERGLDFIIALVSGMEEGEQTEIRLVIDPANRADVRPVGAVRLAGLTQCAAISVKIADPC